jgi:hypothetical protein
MKYLKFVLYILIILHMVPLVSSAHYIVGYVKNANDGTSADGKSVVLWNPTNLSDNLTDIIGPLGNAGVNNYFMIDCELLNVPCEIGDNLLASILNEGDNYISSNSSVVVSGAGFDVASNITLNSPPQIISIMVDDSIADPLNEIDLVVAGNRTVDCIIYVDELDNDIFNNYSAILFDNTFSYYGAVDDNNLHYTNNSCYLNTSYGGEISDYQFICSFYLEYYANPGEWKCVFSIEDNLSVEVNSSDSTNVNELLAINVESPVNYGVLQGNSVSLEKIVNITNYGNVKINLSLSGYGESEGDNVSMGCGDSGNISVNFEKYNLTNSNPGVLDLGEFEQNYKNLTSQVHINNFNLDYRKREDYNEAFNNTYWRIFVPPTITGECNGSIVFGAVTMPGD